MRQLRSRRAAAGQRGNHKPRSARRRSPFGWTERAEPGQTGGARLPAGAIRPLFPHRVSGKPVSWAQSLAPAGERRTQPRGALPASRPGCAWPRPGAGARRPPRAAPPQLSGPSLCLPGSPRPFPSGAEPCGSMRKGNSGKHCRFGAESTAF